MNKLVLNNQKILAWSEYGDLHGSPVFYFHGTPGSHLEAANTDKIARQLGIRIIALDRTGYGNSELHENTEFIDWPNIITSLADKLCLTEFSMLGYSGGAPYALSCAHKLSKRLASTTIISSPTSLTTDIMQQHMNVNFKPLYELADSDFQMAKQQVTEITCSLDAFMGLVTSQLSDSDKLIFEQDEFKDHYFKSLEHSLKQGTDATVIDLRNISRSWGFKLKDIQVKVDIWHGSDDNNFDIAIAEHLASKLNSTLHKMDNCGHYFLFDHWFEILSQIKNTVLAKQANK